MKSKFPVTLLVRGDAKAYSPEQIRDRARKTLTDVIDCIYDEYPPYYLDVGEGVPMTSAMTEPELQSLIAYELYWHDRKLRLQMAAELDEVAKLLWDESGIIFKDVKAINAATQLKKYLNNLKEEVRCPGDDSRWITPSHSSLGGKITEVLKDEDRINKYLGMAAVLMKNTFMAWNAKMIVPNDLLKEVKKAEKDPEDKNEDQQILDESS